jgi:anthranilate phosphoribosyltransferase
VAKHGNRSSTPKIGAEGMAAKCGAADVMEALGVNIQLPPALIGQCLDEVGIAFLFAPAIHSAAKYVQNARRETRLRTVFNVLGPLTNPAGASVQVVGVYALDLVEKVAEALSMLGTHRAFVVHGLDGLDEITITGPTRVAEVRDGQIHTYEITPEEFGLSRAELEQISGGADAAENADIVQRILNGEKSARRDVVLMNAAAALVASGKVAHLKDGAKLASGSIDSGAAARKLRELIEFSNKSH